MPVSLTYTCVSLRNFEDLLYVRIAFRDFSSGAGDTMDTRSLSTTKKTSMNCQLVCAVIKCLELEYCIFPVVVRIFLGSAVDDCGKFKIVGIALWMDQ